MKKSVIFILILFVSYEFAWSQDLIVTERGDSINCKITRQKGNYIYFSYMIENNMRKSLLHNSQIKYFKKDFYVQSFVPSDKLRYMRNYQKLRIGIFAGGSYMLGIISDSIPEDFKKYYKDLKTGHHIGGEAGYFISKNIGVGLKYSNFNSKNKIENIIATNTITGQSRIGSLKDNITIRYFAPVFYLRLYSRNKQLIYSSDFSFGYLDYKNNATLIDDYIVTGKTLGMHMNFGVDLMIDRNLSLGLGLSGTLGSLSRIVMTSGGSKQTIDLKENEMESLSRVDFSIGLRWNL
jgi:hypothetical protein